MNEKLRQGDDIEIRLEPTEIENVSKEVKYVSIPLTLTTNLYRLCLEVQAIDLSQPYVSIVGESSYRILNADVNLMKTLAKEYLLYATNNIIKGK